MWWIGWLAACAPDAPAVEPACLVDDSALTGAVTLPADEAPHEEPIEWWYWTGHLQDDAGRWYGFEETFFQFRMGVFDAVVTNIGFSDLDAGTFTYAYDSTDVLPPAGGEGFDLQVADDRVTGAGGHDTLVGHTPDHAFALDLQQTVSAVFQHGDGYHDYDVGGYTWYYSRPRMQVTGTVTIAGEDLAVTGTAWMDHQWGNLAMIGAAGWDWFAIQLDDGRDVMLFMVRGSDGIVGGTVSDQGCDPRELGADEVHVQALGEWTSPATGCTYPSGWEVQIGDALYTVTPALLDQEVANPNKTYWEGAATVSGAGTGRAYVELAGYCDG